MWTIVEPNMVSGTGAIYAIDKLIAWSSFGAHQIGRYETVAGPYPFYTLFRQRMRGIFYLYMYILN